jgi:hypothetical protein
MDEARRTRRQAVAAALRIVLAEAEMGGVPTKAIKADDLFDIAAQNHVRALGHLAPQQQAKGSLHGATGPVLVLMSPECRRGAHRECDGSPCECPECHGQDIPGVAS